MTTTSDGQGMVPTIRGEIGACILGPDNEPIGLQNPGAPPTDSGTVPNLKFPYAATVAPIPSVPVDLNGSGESVQTVNLERGGYTIQYTDSTGYLIVEPVKRDGSTGAAIINASETSAVTSYASDGPVTLHIRNGGQWSLHFVPLS